MSRRARRKHGRCTAPAKPPTSAAPVPAEPSVEARVFDLFYVCRHRIRGPEMPAGEQLGWTIAAWFFTRLEELHAAYGREAALSAMTGTSE